MIEMRKKTVRTDRLILKAFEEKDRSALIGLLTDPVISRTFMIPDYSSPEEYGLLADRLIRFSHPEERSHLEYGIFRDHQLIGFVNDCGFNENAIEIGYVIHPDHQNQGYATEALKALLPELREMGFHRMTAGFFEENPASRRVMEKCGMVLTAKTETVEYRGRSHRCFYCEILLSSS